MHGNSLRGVLLALELKKDDIKSDKQEKEGKEEKG